MKRNSRLEGTITKLDLYKLHKAEYVTPKSPALVKTKPAQYLTFAGQGVPGDERFTTAIGALYGAAFTIKMTRKFAGKQDYAVCKLEGQWFVEGDMAAIPKETWKWKLLIRTPDFVSQQDLKAAAAAALKKNKPQEIEEVTLERIDEGLCVQMLHIGPYDKESDSIALMRSFAEAKGLKFSGPHHEIYLSDPRRAPAERLKTILRNPTSRPAL
jgi:hypothetical protein